MVLSIMLIIFVSFTYITVFSLCKIAGKEDEYYENINLLFDDNIESLTTNEGEQTSKIQTLVEVHSI